MAVYCSPLSSAGINLCLWCRLPPKRFIANETSQYSMTDWIFITSRPGGLYAFPTAVCHEPPFFHHQFLYLYFCLTPFFCILSFFWYLECGCIWFIFLFPFVLSFSNFNKNPAVVRYLHEQLISKSVLEPACVHSHLFAFQASSS